MPWTDTRIIEHTLAREGCFHNAYRGKQNRLGGGQHSYKSKLGVG